MPPSELPSLNALRAFEAVARHCSFRRAAEELFVTPAAITHQIKLLEGNLGISLFNRFNRRIELTEASKAVLPMLQQGFESLSTAVAELRRYGKVPQLTVGASPTLASRWLMPRLQRFLSTHPGIDVHLVATSQAVSTATSNIRRNGSKSAAPPERDIDIRFTNDDLTGEQVDLLFRVEIVPMCHPRLLIGPPPLLTPADLKYQTLLHGDGRNPERAGSTWARWLRRAGVTGIDTRRGIQLDHSSLALDAAADGLGVTLASPLLASAELAEGAVVIAFPQALPLDNAYYVVTSDLAMAREEVAAFHRWLMAEARTPESVEAVAA